MITLQLNANQLCVVLFALAHCQDSACGGGGGGAVSMEGQGVVLNGKYFEPEMFNLMKNSHVRKEAICEMCEEEQGDMLVCDGVCQGTYHVSCLGLFKRPAGVFKCDSCTTGA